MARRLTRRSERAFAKAQRLIPGGVNSPVRAFKAVGGTPLFIKSAKGAYITDIDGNEYIDYVQSWGALPLGHAHPAVVEAIAKQAAKGTSYGAPTELETELAELITRAMPAIEMIRFVSSGTEAVMSALRVARAFTGRHTIVKFDGCYHGHADSMLVSAGSGVATLGLPDSPGVTPGAVCNTVSIPYNDIPTVESLFAARGRDIAAVIVEPVAANMGVVLPVPGFLETLRRLTTKHDALLIFDEIITAFRVHPGGAQTLYGVTPDVTTLGKIIGGGLPVGAYGGRRDIMQLVAPSGPVYQAGTLSGNPLAMAAGIAALRELQRRGVWSRIEATTASLAIALSGLTAGGIQAQVPHVGTLLSLVLNDRTAFEPLFHAMLDRGVYLPPSSFESWFVSAAHGERETRRTATAFTAINTSTSQPASRSTPATAFPRQAVAIPAMSEIRRRAHATPSSRPGQSHRRSSM
jgi:glutamate-1-semialdehyde 2,1-aminomutase